MSRMTDCIALDESEFSVSGWMENARGKPEKRSDILFSHF